MEEAKWFQASDWNGEHHTTVVAILIRSASHKKLVGAPSRDIVARSLEPYLEKLGFSLDKKVTFTQSGELLQKSFDGWIVDLAFRSVKRVTSWEVTLEKRNRPEEFLPVVWPSHLPIFMQEKRGALTGATFGI